MVLLYAIGHRQYYVYSHSSRLQNYQPHSSSCSISNSSGISNSSSSNICSICNSSSISNSNNNGRIAQSLGFEGHGSFWQCFLAKLSTYLS